MRFDHSYGLRNSMIITVIVIFAIFTTFCCRDTANVGNYNRTPPEQVDDGWRISSLAEQGINDSLILDLNSRIIENEYRNVHALLIVKNDYLVFEKYYNGYDRNDTHRIFSVTKSVSSALIGIAIENDFIQNVDEHIIGFLPEYNYIDWSNGKDQITICNLLTMRSGLEWEELAYPYPDPRNSHYQMSRTGNWLEFVLQRPMVHSPGTVFEYNTGTSNLFARLIENAVGIPVETFAEENLFEPLGITIYSWYNDPEGNPCTGGSNGGLRLRPRDMARFGYLYLNGGKWSGNQIISSEWVSESIAEHVTFPYEKGYGYQWWRRQFTVAETTFDGFYALGYGGQYIFVVAEIDMMVVYTSGNYERDYAYSQALEIMSSYILPAVID